MLALRARGVRVWTRGAFVTPLAHDVARSGGPARELREGAVRVLYALSLQERGRVCSCTGGYPARRRRNDTGGRGCPTAGSECGHLLWRSAPRAASSRPPEGPLRGVPILVLRRLGSPDLVQ